MINDTFTSIKIFLLILLLGLWGQVCEARPTGLPFISYSLGNEQRSSQFSMRENVLAKARGLLREGDISGAINAFSLLLLREPDAYEAMTSLLYLRDYPHLPVSVQADLLQLEDLIKNIGHLQVNLDYYQEKNNQLREYLGDKGINSSFISARLDKIQSLIPSLEEHLQEHRNFVSYDKNPLKAVVNLYLQKHNVLSAQLSLGEKQFQTLRELYNSDISQIKLQQQSLSLSKKIKNDSDEITLLKKELSLVYQDINSLQDFLKQREDKIQQLTDQIVTYALKLSEDEMSVSEHLSDVSQLKGRFLDMQSRLELNEKIIGEKEAILRSQKDQLEWFPQEIQNLKGEWAQKLSAKDKEIKEINSFLDIYQNKLSDVNQMIMTKDELLRKFKNDLADLNKKLETHQMTMGEQQQQITLLKKSLEDLHLDKIEVNEKLSQDLSVKDNDLKQLKNTLDLYRGKLTDARDSIRHNMSMITNLGNYLDSMQTKLNDKDHMLKKNQNNLMTLEEQLRDIQKYLMDLRQRNSPLHALVPDEDFNRLQSRLRDIDYFLSKEIENFSDSISSVP